MKKCVFSVIIPCYNSEAYVANAVESIVNQTYPEWELILINDGSTDNTLSIINGYAEKDQRIKVFSKENGGYATAVNYGLDNISGDYFLFLGSDDKLDVHLFEELYKQIEALNEMPDMIAFRTRAVIDGIVKGIDGYTDFHAVAFHQCSIKEFIELDPASSAIFSARDTSRCYKRDLLGDTRYFGTTGMDADGIFSMLICHKARSFLNVPVDGYYWTLRGDSVSATYSLRKQLDRISNWHQFFEVISNSYAEEITKTEKHYLCNYSHQLVELSMSFKNAAKNRGIIKKEANYCKDMARKFNVDTHRFLPFVAKAPVTFSVFFGFAQAVRRLLKKQ